MIDKIILRAYTDMLALTSIALKLEKKKEVRPWSQAHYREVRCLGKGGFGSVVSAVGRLDARAVAVKKVHFRSAVPPWAANDSLVGRCRLTPSNPR